MAGSYRHCVNADSKFIGIDLIDNLGDAHEALEEMYDMIEYLSDLNADLMRPGDAKARIHEAWLNGHIKKRYGQAHIDQDPKVFSYERFWESDDEDE